MTQGRATSEEPPVRVFFSYAHENGEALDEIQMRLAAYVRSGLLKLRDDQKFIPSDRLSDRIRTEITEADIVVLLVSPHFVDSYYCYDQELKFALEMNKEKNTRILPVIIEDTRGLNDLEISEFIFIPSDGTPLNKSANRTKALNDIAEGIAKAAKDIRGSSAYPGNPSIRPSAGTGHSTDEWTIDDASLFGSRNAPATDADAVAYLKSIRGRIADGTFGDALFPLAPHWAARPCPEAPAIRQTALIGMDGCLVTPDAAIARIQQTGASFIIVEGPPGSGKTALLAALASCLADEWTASYFRFPRSFRSRRFPVVLLASDTVRRLRANRLSWPPEDRHHTPPRGVFPWLAARKRGWLLLDGLDGIPEPADRKALMEKLIDEFSFGNQVIVACRRATDILPGRIEPQLVTLSRVGAGAFNHELGNHQAIPDSEEERVGWALTPLGVAMAARSAPVPGAASLNLSSLFTAILDRLAADEQTAPQSLGLPAAFDAARTLVGDGPQGTTLAWDGDDDTLTFATEMLPPARLPALLEDVARTGLPRPEPVARGLLAHAWSFELADKAIALAHTLAPPDVVRTAAPLLGRPGLGQAMLLLLAGRADAPEGAFWSRTLPAADVQDGNPMAARWLEFVGRLPGDLPRLTRLAAERPDALQPPWRCWWRCLSSRNVAVPKPWLRASLDEADGKSLTPMLAMLWTLELEEVTELLRVALAKRGGQAADIHRLAALTRVRWPNGVLAAPKHGLSPRIADLASWRPNGMDWNWAADCAHALALPAFASEGNPWPALHALDAGIFGTGLADMGVPLAGEAVALGCTLIGTRRRPWRLFPLRGVSADTIRALAMLGWLGWHFRDDLEAVLDSQARSDDDALLARARRLWAEGLPAAPGKPLTATALEAWLEADDVTRMDQAARFRTLPMEESEIRRAYPRTPQSQGWQGRCAGSPFGDQRVSLIHSFTRAFQFCDSGGVPESASLHASRAASGRPRLFSRTPLTTLRSGFRPNKVFMKMSMSESMVMFTNAL